MLFGHILYFFTMLVLLRLQILAGFGFYFETGTSGILLVKLHVLTFIPSMIRGSGSIERPGPGQHEATAGVWSVYPPTP